METVTQEELRKYRALMAESNVEIDKEALEVIVKLLRLNVSPDEIHLVIKRLSPHCGILKRFRLRSKPTVENR